MLTYTCKCFQNQLCQYCIELPTTMFTVYSWVASSYCTHIRTKIQTVLPCLQLIGAVIIKLFRR